MRRKRGFTLIELSIVLVIIGLIVGGVLVGKDLIKAAERRKTVGEVESLNAAVYAFRLKYGCTPGDCPNATDYWGAASTCPIPYWGGGYSRPQTCNGDNNGIVSGEEQYTLFGQLSNAELIAQQAYSGNCCSTFNAPATGLRSTAYGNAGQYGAGYSILYISDNNAYAFTGVNAPRGSAFVREDGHNWLLGSTIQGNVVNYGPVMTSADAFDLDTKMDDGKPAKGKVKTWRTEGDFFSYWSSRSLPLCASTTDANTAEYNMAVAGNNINCSMLFRTGF